MAERISAQELIGKCENAKDLVSFETVKGRIKPRLVPKSELPHTTFLDMDVEYSVALGETDEGVMNALVTDDLLKLWGVTIEEVHERAVANLNPSLNTLLGTLAELSGGEDGGNDDFPVYVLSNPSRTYGAAEIMGEKFLNYLSVEWKDDIAIIPSSVHETLLMPVKSIESTKYVVDMIREINRTVVDPSEVLSDNLYVFSPVSGYKIA